MKRRSKPKTPAKKPGRPRVADPAIEIIVRRGALRRFDSLSKKTVGLDVTLSWDRRVADAASPAASERRSQAPFTWEVADFVVVERRTPKKSK